MFVYCQYCINVDLYFSCQARFSVQKQYCLHFSTCMGIIKLYEVMRMYYDVFILSCMLERPCYGYEIKKYLVDHFSACSNISNNTLYPLLKKYEKMGVTDRTVETVVGKPSRIIYHLTDAGRKYFVDMLQSFPETVLYDRDEFLTRLSFFAFLNPDTRKRMLTGRRAILQQYLQRLESFSSVKRPDDQPPYPELKAFHRQLLLSELTVLDQFEARLCDPCTLSDDGYVLR